jgi:hypothetical protein
MKALADIRRRQMSTTTAAAAPQNEDFNHNRSSLRKPTRYRLHAVTPLEVPTLADSVEVDDEVTRGNRDSQSMTGTNLVIRPVFHNKAKAQTMTTPKLTTEEFIQVRLATVRESTRHCYWPSEVVARFAAADVIR